MLAAAYAANRASHAVQIKGDDPGEKWYPGPAGWGLGVGFTTPHHKNNLFQNRRGPRLTQGCSAERMDMRKEKLNNLCRIQLKAAQDWGNTWYTFLDSIHGSINQELELLYHENICYRRTFTNATTNNCATWGYRSELLYTRSPCFMIMCCRSFCFNL